MIHARVSYDVGEVPGLIAVSISEAWMSDDPCPDCACCWALDCSERVCMSGTCPCRPTR